MSFMETVGPILAQVGFWSVIVVVGSVLVLGVVGGLTWWNYQRKRWYIKAEFKMATDDGRSAGAEWGKGYFDPKKGVVWLKRKGKAKEYCECEDIRKFLQGQNIITLVGAPGDWKLVIPQSFLTVIDEETGREASVMELATRMGRERVWRGYTERAFIEAYTIETIWGTLKDYVGWGLVIFIVIIAQVISHFLGS